MPTFAVTPVIDYEPPTGNPPRCRVAPQVPPRPSLPHTPALGGAAQAAAPLSPQMREAAVFADAALRRVLEVIDRRRPAIQLRSVLAPELVDSVLAVSRKLADQPGAAVLRRMRLQPADGAGHSAAEVFGTYSRGDRIHAIAARAQRLPGQWLLVALHIG
ncbi:hypothetical protein Mkiyose1665_16930 [Mycobacterium kiyosense]|uniref:Alanine, arginine and proline rich protein n=1 Tax=Mycobacterium kiyosense TaxID=2871094 RepID=A0A9P3Q4E2_9MYCO|nr:MULTISPECIES: Rv3235 family protein [Mycobacterium]BDB40910.1 hypothetical protein IWGMT90018_13560 [Mycobacterium kiyosense]BDE12706.1 hypothetical protein MKCMC460_15660 [Mycobacterium sp. 20KCMC460]GLB82647.1 hypothetical protein SRL2020028_19030 [Mycobacterium kiyosense]GLB87847.1 hypothetical protein SRL2020130_06640 [Mycobacterium kiyosense]GLB94004.1 hypothetical protein SRL2020226_07800 [Mycobacterium kiyosense]